MEEEKKAPEELFFVPISKRNQEMLKSMAADLDRMRAQFNNMIESLFAEKDVTGKDWRMSRDFSGFVREPQYTPPTPKEPEEKAK